MITFLYGSAGSGKTSRVISGILRDLREGRRVLLLVPEQEAMSAERDITEAALKAAPPCPTEGLEVLNFTRLANRVFRQLGGLSYRVIDGRGKSLIMWQALKQVEPLLREYRESYSDPEGLIRLMLSAVKELKLCGITSDRLIVASEELKEEQPRLSDKLYDLSLIYAAYETFLHTRYDDPLDDLPRLCALLRENRVFADYRVYIDSFRGFTPQEYEVIGCLFRGAENVTVTLGYLPGGNEPHFDSIRETAKRLSRLAGEHEEIVLSGSYRFSRNPALGYLSRNLWKYAGHDAEEERYRDQIPEGITILHCPDRYAEAEAACRRICRLVRETGCRYSDITLLAHSAEQYDGIIDVMLEKYGIPYFMSRRTKLSEKPLIKLISSLFALKRFHMRTEDMITCIKTGLTPLSSDECDIFEGYLYTWSLCGARLTSEEPWHMNPSGYVMEFSESEKAELDTVNDCRVRLIPQITAFFESLGAGATVRSVCEALYRFLSEWNVKETLALLDPDDAIPVWNEVMAILDQAVRVIGDEKTDAEVFSRIFSMMVAESDIGHLPASMDEVTVGSATLLRAGKPRHVFLLGVNEGEFPAAVKENSVFSDNDKAVLETYDITLSPNTSLLASEELYIFWQAVSSPSETLTVLFHPLREEDTGKLSVAANRIHRLFPCLPILSEKVLPASDAAQHYAASFDLCVGDSPLARSLRVLYAGDPDYTARLNAMQHPIVNTAETVSEQTVKQLFPNGVTLSSTALESFVLCAFGYYCNHILRLQNRRRAVIRPNDTGTLIHFILENFVRAIRTESGIRTDLSDKEIDELVEKCINEYLDSVFGGQNRIAEQSKRLLSLIERLKRFTLVLVRNLLAEFAQSDFIPQFFELQIGDREGDIPPLRIPLPDGSEAKVIGRIDRVDTFRRGDELYVRVVDYKTGSKTFSLSDLSRGLNMQMLLYLFSIWQNATPGFLEKAGADPGTKVLPAGVLYFRAVPVTLSLSEKTDKAAVETLVQKEMTRSGILLNDSEILCAMEHDLAEKFIPVSAKPTAKKNAKNLQTLEEFGALLRRISEITAQFASLIAAGNADISPLQCKDKDGCRYCKMRPVCKKIGGRRDERADTGSEKGGEE